MAGELDDTSLGDLSNEFLLGPPFVAPEDFIIRQDVLESILSSTFLDFAYPGGPLGDPSIIPGSSLFHDIPSLPSFPPLTTAQVDDRERLRAIYSVQIPPSPPIPAPPIATLYPHNWRKIPQKDYDYGKKQWNFRASEPILFFVNGRLGVNLGDALRKRFTGLDGRDDLVLQDARDAISCRLSFPGYPRNNSPQIFTKRWNKKRDPISRSHLAYQVARKIQHYLDSMANPNNNDGTAHGQWTIGEGFMRLDNMFMVRLEAVSSGSYQPEIWVADHTLAA